MVNNVVHDTSFIHHASPASQERDRLKRFILLEMEIDGLS